MASGIKKTKDGFSDWQKKLIDKTRSMQGAFSRDVYTIYQNAQMKRWETENTSEGDKWEALNPAYKKRKLTQFASFPGGGSKMLIATGKLVQATVGLDKTYHRALFNETSMTISVTLPYAGYVDEVRPFMKFSRDTLQLMKEKLKEYLLE